MTALPVRMYARRRAGNVTSARAEWDKPPRVNKAGRGRSSAQNAGLRYERKVLDHLAEVLPLFLDHLSFSYTSDWVDERCIPDGIALSSSRPHLLTVIEVKHRHTADGWFQLTHSYLPVVKRAFPHHQIQLLEVCKSYDPGIKLPEPISLVEDLPKVVNQGLDNRFGIYIWTGR